MKIFTVLLAAIILSLFTGCGGDTELTYVINGEGRADISWTTMDKDICSSNDLLLPWSYTIIIDDNSPDYAQLSATINSIDGYAEVQIIIDGDVVRTAYASGLDAFTSVTYP